ncbi:MAG: hypothetical protein ACLFV0_00175 [Nitriliruptoraceae bacterium]
MSVTVGLEVVTSCTLLVTGVCADPVTSEAPDGLGWGVSSERVPPAVRLSTPGAEV